MARELPKPTSIKSSKPTHEAITRRAYEIFLERGCPEGHDLEHWLAAEAELIAESESKKSAKPSSKGIKASNAIATRRP